MTYLEAKNGKLYCGQSPILLRGFGLGGWLLPEGYMWGLYDKCDRPRRMEMMIEALCGKAYATSFWKRYYDTYITEADIKFIADRGLNSVRLPINARHLYAHENGRIVFDSETIALIDQSIEWCKRYEIYVVLDMHGAPGGQTGANIDDSLEDLPSLFTNPVDEADLIELWGMLAERYKDEPIIAGYDLLNEPLPNWFNQYNHLLMPLYEKLIKRIRAVDSKHLIILEGLHWATDFSVFDTLAPEDVKDGIVLEFHKYWSNPDQESITAFIETSARLGIPLFMGESGENNLDWYTTMFPLLERLEISWSFWSYKKMSCKNSPITFDKPDYWHKIEHWAEQNQAFLQGKGPITGDPIEPSEAQAIFNHFLESIAHPKVNEEVVNSLLRKVTLSIPAEAFDRYEAASDKVRGEGADLRSCDPIDILFENGKTGEVDYKRHNGASQPEEERLIVALKQGESVSYDFRTDVDVVDLSVKLSVKLSEKLGGNFTDDDRISNKVIISIDDQIVAHTILENRVIHFRYHRNVSDKALTQHRLKITCEIGDLLLDEIELKRGV